jgi:protein SCO1/2
MIDANQTIVRPRSRWPRLLAVVAAAVLGVVVGVWLFRPHPFAGAVLQAPTPAPALEDLVFHTGAPADLPALRGDVVLVFFGYTHCPDICPTTLATAARAKEQLGRQADRVQVLMVTVDPERDDEASLGAYVTGFDRDFLGVTGDPVKLREAATVYGVFVEHDASSHDIGHTANLMAIDPDGYLRVVYSHEVAPDALAADLRELLG